MSIPNRIVRLSKAYLNQVRDRIDSELSERESAVRELEGGNAGSRIEAGDADSLMRRAEEKIAAARRELEARQESTPPAGGTLHTPAASADPNAVDYRILNVPVGSDLATVQAAYEKLVNRCDPRRFPDGSAEQKDAQRILERVNASYELLQKRLDPMQNRFGKLELE